MSKNTARKYRRTIDYLEDYVGADVARDVARTALVEIDDPVASDGIPTDVQEIGGEPQSAVDVALKIDQIQAALVSAGGDELRVASPSPLDVSAAEVDVDLATQSLARAAVEPELDDGTGTYGAVHRRSNAVRQSIENSEIAVPTDQQDALEKSTENYGTDIETTVTFTLQLDGYATAELLFVNADSATDLTVEQSWDDTNYFAVDTATGTDSYTQTYTAVTAKYLRVEVTGTGTAGDTADVVLGGSP